MAHFPLIVCYYTKDTLYQLEVQNLIASCEKWGLDHHIEPIATLGSWERNCSFKPFFLLQKLAHFRRPLFWVDADAVFMRRPEWLEVFNSDFAVRMDERLSSDDPSRVLSGSIFVNATKGAVELLKAWGQKCIDSFSNPHRIEEVWDQMVLRDLIASTELKAKIGTLPWEYVAIFDQIEEGRTESQIVIAHHQASRRFKRMINEK